MEPAKDFTSYYVDGGKLEEGDSRNGQRHGRWRSWHPDGKLWQECDYQDGELVRTTSLRDESGRETVLEDGEIEVWKACVAKGAGGDVAVYVQLRVPADAKRVTPRDVEHRYQGRVDRAFVVGITDADGKKYEEARSFVYHFGKLTYKLGQEVRPDGFQTNALLRYAQGIHVHRHKDHCDRWFRERGWGAVPVPMPVPVPEAPNQ